MAVLHIPAGADLRSEADHDRSDKWARRAILHEDCCQMAGDRTDRGIVRYRLPVLSEPHRAGLQQLSRFGPVSAVQLGLVIVRFQEQRFPNHSASGGWERGCCKCLPRRPGC